MAADAAALLDQLMGSHRDAVPGDNIKETQWWDPEVIQEASNGCVSSFNVDSCTCYCRSVSTICADSVLVSSLQTPGLMLVSGDFVRIPPVQPNDVTFVSPQVHVKRSTMKSSGKRKSYVSSFLQDPPTALPPCSYEESDRKGKMGLEDEFLDTLEKLVRDLDRKITRGKERLRKSADAKEEVLLYDSKMDLVTLCVCMSYLTKGGPTSEKLKCFSVEINNTVTEVRQCCPSLYLL